MTASLTNYTSSFGQGFFKNGFRLMKHTFVNPSKWSVFRELVIRKCLSILLTYWYLFGHMFLWWQSRHKSKLGHSVQWNRVFTMYTFSQPSHRILETRSFYKETGIRSLWELSSQFIRNIMLYNAGYLCKFRKFDETQPYLVAAQNAT